LLGHALAVPLRATGTVSSRRDVVNGSRSSNLCQQVAARSSRHLLGALAGFAAAPRSRKPMCYSGLLQNATIFRPSGPGAFPGRGLCFVLARVESPPHQRSGRNVE
jgi:hypothetical protein